MQVSTNDFRKGMKIEVDGAPYAIVDFQHVKPGKGGAFVRTKLKHLRLGTVIDRTFRAEEKVPLVNFEEKRMQFLYRDDRFHFMDLETYDQIALSEDEVRDARQFLQENTEVEVLYVDGAPIGIELPNFVDLVVVKTEPGVRGDTASGGSKPATLETGAVVSVPLFINEGDVLRVDTRTGAYISRTAAAAGAGEERGKAQRRCGPSPQRGAAAHRSRAGARPVGTGGEPGGNPHPYPAGGGSRRGARRADPAGAGRESRGPPRHRRGTHGRHLLPGAFPDHRPVREGGGRHQGRAGALHHRSHEAHERDRIEGGRPDLQDPGRERSTGRVRPTPLPPRTQGLTRRKSQWRPVPTAGQLSSAPSPGARRAGPRRCGRRQAPSGAPRGYSAPSLSRCSPFPSPVPRSSGSLPRRPTSRAIPEPGSSGCRPRGPNSPRSPSSRKRESGSTAPASIPTPASASPTPWSESEKTRSSARTWRAASRAGAGRASAPGRPRRPVFSSTRGSSRSPNPRPS